MSSISDDTESGLAMLLDAYQKLQEKDPNHELLKLGKLHDDKLGITFTNKYYKRCARDNDEWRVQAYTRYFFAMKAAAEGEPIKLLDTNPPCDF